MKIKSILSLLVACISISAMANAPKYVFYFIGDGMGMGHIIATETYKRVALGDNTPLLMMQFPVSSIVQTYPASEPITDSAAAGTALSTGYKTMNGMLGVTPDTTHVYSVAAQLKEKGYGVGILTSVAPDDATPAAFYAHQPSRKMYYEIGKDAAASGYEFIGGSMLRGTKDTDLLKVLADSNVTVAHGMEQLANATTRRVILLNPEDHYRGQIGYTVDSIKGALNLPDMTRACLDHMLKTSPDRFFMMVEGGNIDYAGHSNDGGAVIKEVINFNEALAVAYEFYLAHPDETLIVVSADHDTGGMIIGHSHSGYGGWIRNIKHQNISKDSFGDLCKSLLMSRRIFTWEDMKELLADRLGFWSKFKIPADAEEALQEKFEDTFSGRNSKEEKTLYQSFNEFTVLVFKTMDAATGIDWTTTGHSGNPVPLFSIGVGADEFKTVHNNIEIPQTIRRLTGIE